MKQAFMLLCWDTRSSIQIEHYRNESIWAFYGEYLSLANRLIFQFHVYFCDQFQWPYTYFIHTFLNKQKHFSNYPMCGYTTDEIVRNFHFETLLQWNGDSHEITNDTKEFENRNDETTFPHKGLFNEKNALCWAGFSISLFWISLNMEWFVENVRIHLSNVCQKWKWA